MDTLFVITDSAKFATAVGHYTAFAHGMAAKAIVIPLTPPARPASHRWTLALFRHVADLIEFDGHSEGNPQALRNAVAIIDLHDVELRRLEELDPLRVDQPQAALVAMLVLAFPEIHWVFVTSHEVNAGQDFKRAHILNSSADLQSVISSQLNGYCLLFDATGLRNLLRKNIRASVSASRIPLRNLVAVAIDDEQSYAYFNAYMAYRFGFRSHVVCSYALMCEMFGSDGGIDAAVTIAFEDLYLRFPDRDPWHAALLSNLKERDETFRPLAKTRYRLVVTSGHDRFVKEEDQLQAKRYLEELRLRGLWNDTAYKPYSGIIDFWLDLSKKIQKTHRGGNDIQWRRRPRGILRTAASKPCATAFGYEWPPEEIPAGDPHTGGHSTPGRLLEVAERLTNRADRIMKNAINVPDAIHGALVATEAIELLGNQTPTASLRALSLKHQLEVTAECMFYGVQRNLDVGNRVHDIRVDIDAISFWFNAAHRSRMVNSAQRGIVDSLVLKFRAFNQFDEEMECLREARRLWRDSRPWYLRWPLSYVVGLVNSLKLLLLSTVAWIVIFGFAYYYLSIRGSIEEWGKYSALTFMGIGILDSYAPASIGPGAMPPAGIASLVLLEVILAYLHLGTLVAHFYAMVARR